MPNTNQSSIGGVSAVNPQARGNYQQYIDAAYDNTKGRLDPIFEQQRNAYNQQMVNMGLPVGGEAYNKSFQQMDQNQNDAYSNASFGAMGFGLDAQNQDFNQDATRSGLANALLQSKWGTDLGYYNTDTNAALTREGLAEGGRQFDTGLAEGGRQYDNSLGLQYDNLGQRGYEFDSGLDKQYWDSQNQYDYMYDRAGQDDYRYGVGQDRQDYYDQQNATRYDDAFIMQLLGMGGTPGVYTQDPTSAYNNQIGQLGASQRQMTDIASSLFDDIMSSSDARLKDNIRKVGSLKGQNIYTWTWNKIAQGLGINGPTFGVIAQEVDPAYLGVKDGYLAVDYRGLFGVA